VSDDITNLTSMLALKVKVQGQRSPRSVELLTDRQTHGQTDRRTDILTDRHIKTDRYTDTDRQTDEDRQTDT